VDNLRREGVGDERVFLVGNVMIDTLLKQRRRAEESAILKDLRLTEGQYAVLTLHRPSNVDNPAVLGGLLDVIDVVQKDMPVVFPIHPRTRKSLEGSALGARAAEMANLKMIEPAGYLDFLKLMASARLVLTDSGGIQEETTILKVRCLTLRDSTERPVTAEVGSNRVVGTDPQKIIRAYEETKNGNSSQYGVPPLWDGHAADRIVKILLERLG
jgi:UDP-N-acetylglucosamine 2-epimerase (non-hydrolysing)